jgi:hypothetical protein
VSLKAAMGMNRQGAKTPRREDVLFLDIEAFHPLGESCSAREPADIGVPSTPPVLPRSAQDDRVWGSALALEIVRLTKAKAL